MLWELYGLPAQSDRVIRPRNRRSLETKSSVRMELPSTGTEMLESMLIRVPPGAGSHGTSSKNTFFTFTCSKSGSTATYFSRAIASGSRATVVIDGSIHRTQKRRFCWQILLQHSEVAASVHVRN